MVEKLSSFLGVLELFSRMLSHEKKVFFLSEGVLFRVDFFKLHLQRVELSRRILSLLLKAEHTTLKRFHLGTKLTFKILLETSLVKGLRNHGLAFNLFFHQVRSQHLEAVDFLLQTGNLLSELFNILSLLICLSHLLLAFLDHHLTVLHQPGLFLP